MKRFQFNNTHTCLTAFECDSNSLFSVIDEHTSKKCLFVLQKLDDCCQRIHGQSNTDNEYVELTLEKGIGPFENVLVVDEYLTLVFNVLNDFRVSVCIFSTTKKVVALPCSQTNKLSTIHENMLKFTEVENA